MGLGQIAGAFIKAGAKKTDDIIEAGTTGKLKTNAQDAYKPVDQVVDDVAPDVPPTAEAIVKSEVDEVITPTPTAETTEVTTPTLDPIEEASAITTPKEELEMGLPSANDPSSRNINFDYIEESDQILTVIDNIGTINKDFVDARGGVMKDATVNAKASQLKLEDIIGFKLGDGVSPERIRGARIALTSSAKDLEKRANQILDGNATTVEQLAFRQAVSNHVAIQQSLAGMSAEAGRSLRQFSLPVNADSPGMPLGGPVARSQLDDMFKGSGGNDAVTKMADYILKADGDIQKITKRTQQVSGSTTGDVILEYWINGLLSSPATHMVNVTSNALVALWSIPERMLASGFSKALKPLDNLTGSSEAGVELGESLAQMYGMIYGMRDGLRMAGKVIKTGDPSDPLMKLEARKYRAISAENFGMKKGGLANTVDFMGNVLRLPGRFLGAEDEFFKTVGYRMELNALAYRKAVGEGLKGDDLAKRIVDLIENPTQEIHLDSQNISRLNTFTNPLGDFGQKVQGLSNAHPLMKLVIPFVRTPLNIVKYVGVRSPVAPFAKSFRADMKAGGARRDMALSKMTLGTTLLSLGAVMAGEGTITGAGPKNKAMRNALRRQGWQPYSILIDGTYYSFNRSDPIGMFMGLSADLMNSMKNGDIETNGDLAVYALVAIAKNLTSRTYLRGLSDTMNVLSDPDRYKERYFRRMASSFTPMTSLVANVERALDPTMRATYDLMDEICGRTPGCSDSLPPRRNVWGEAVVLQGGLGWDFVSPVYTSERKPTIVDDEIYNHEINVVMPRRKFGTGNFTVELNAEEYDRFAILSGKETKVKYVSDRGVSKNLNLFNYLKATMMDRTYSSLTDGPDGTKADMVEGIVRMFRGEAKIALLKEFPALKAEVDKQKMSQINAKTPQDSFFSNQFNYDDEATEGFDPATFNIPDQYVQ